MQNFSVLIIALLCCINTAIAQPKKEFRGVWVATVQNIDWPSAQNLSTTQQQQEFLALLNMHKNNGLNALVVQIRPSADAFYASPFEPWSAFLNGQQGKAPSPFYDPLAFMVAETHKAGLEFHAWINPYRAETKLNNPQTSPTHITRLYPSWFVTYDDKKYFNPGNPQAQKFLVQVVADIVERYNVDAIHFDDYFYPYRVPGKDFPDEDTYQAYKGNLLKDDWRRANVDTIIKHLYTAIKQQNPKCQFGISPFGVWRNSDKDSINGSNTRAGQTNYDDLYANVLLWMQKGWVDYVTPQLYWEFEHKAAPYQTLLDWWNTHTYGVNCYIGIGYYRANSNANWRQNTQLTRQIQAARAAKNVNGFVFFSSKSFVKNPNGWNDSLRLNYFKEPYFK
jgi:uncharacterized lipoprotein YddW (UPF0748 family)